uniref:IBH1-like N-terminal domain-containing protein n=1 Tax=Picea sitchensis TaxID=3332 RepID=D5A9V6_PICSI|nr:unknown [Picea sitchensis]
MEGKCGNMSRIQVYLTHLLPALQKIQKRRSSLTQRQRAIRCVADMCLVQTVKKGSAWSRALNLRLMRREKTMKTKMKESSLRQRHSVTLARRMRLDSLSSRCCSNVDIKAGSHDHGSIGGRLGTLQRLVPGGRNMGFDTLFQETADYILNLEVQVHAMEALAEFYASSTGLVDETITQQ